HSTERWQSNKVARRPLFSDRKGLTSVIAMLFLCLLSTLAIGFYASTTISGQIAGNDRRANDAQIALESGVAFAKYELVALNLPYGTTPANLMTNVVKQLGFHLNSTTNMGGSVVTNAAGTV